METESSTCQLCNGSGLKITGEEFYMEECECVQIKRMRDHVKELKTTKFLKETKLLVELNKNRSLMIETDMFNAARCHIKTALVLNGRMKSFKIVNPGQLVALSIDNPGLIESVDLLVIESPSFPHYEAAAKRHEFTIATRESWGRPTWFVVDRTYQKFKEKNPIITEGLRLLLDTFKIVKISQSDTLSQIKTPSVTEVIKVNKGFGLVGVNAKLLEFHPEMDQRLHDIKE